MENKDGGPAFPGGHGCFTGPTVGMSLRDYFAAAALTGYLSGPGAECDNARMNPKHVAKWCYDDADAMIAAREAKEAK